MMIIAVFSFFPPETKDGPNGVRSTVGRTGAVMSNSICGLEVPTAVEGPVVDRAGSIVGLAHVDLDSRDVQMTDSTRLMSLAVAVSEPCVPSTLNSISKISFPGTLHEASTVPIEPLGYSRVAARVSSISGE